MRAVFTARLVWTLMEMETYDQRGSHVLCHHDLPQQRRQGFCLPLSLSARPVFLSRCCRKVHPKGGAGGVRVRRRGRTAARVSAHEEKKQTKNAVQIFKLHKQNLLLAPATQVVAQGATYWR